MCGAMYATYLVVAAAVVACVILLLLLAVIQRRRLDRRFARRVGRFQRRPELGTAQVADPEEWTRPY